MRLLLDTQVFLWFLSDSRRLGRSARRTIIDADEVYVSAATIWESAIKVRLGKLQVDLSALVDGIVASGFLELPLRARHAITVASLPEHHRDPFDRVLVAQAITESLRLLTADALLRRYTDQVEVIG